MKKNYDQTFLDKFFKRFKNAQRPVVALCEDSDIGYEPNPPAQPVNGQPVPPRTYNKQRLNYSGVTENPGELLSHSVFVSSSTTDKPLVLQHTSPSADTRTTFYQVTGVKGLGQLADNPNLFVSISPEEAAREHLPPLYSWTPTYDELQRIEGSIKARVIDGIIKKREAAAPQAAAVVAAPAKAAEAAAAAKGLATARSQEAAEAQRQLADARQRLNQATETAAKAAAAIPAQAAPDTAAGAVVPDAEAVAATEKAAAQARTEAEKVAAQAQSAAEKAQAEVQMWEAESQKRTAIAAEREILAKLMEEVATAAGNAPAANKGTALTLEELREVDLEVSKAVKTDIDAKRPQKERAQYHYALQQSALWHAREMFQRISGPDKKPVVCVVIGKSEENEIAFRERYQVDEQNSFYQHYKVLHGELPREAFRLSVTDTFQFNHPVEMYKFIHDDKNPTLSTQAFDILYDIYKRTIGRTTPKGKPDPNPVVFYSKKGLDRGPKFAFAFYLLSKFDELFLTADTRPELNQLIFQAFETFRASHSPIALSNIHDLNQSFYLAWGLRMVEIQKECIGDLRDYLNKNSTVPAFEHKRLTIQEMLNCLEDISDAPGKTLEVRYASFLSMLAANFDELSTKVGLAAYLPGEAEFYTMLKKIAAVTLLRIEVEKVTLPILAGQVPAFNEANQHGARLSSQGYFKPAAARASSSGESGAPPVSPYASPSSGGGQS